MAIVHLMRHGQTTYNVEKRFSGRGSDPELTPYGIEAAFNVGQWLSIQHNISLIISSNMTRTNQTASMVNHHLNAPILYDNELQEKHKGVFEGEFIAEALPFILQLADHESPPGGESEIEFRLRITKAICPYLQLEESLEILLVTHGYSVRIAKEVFLEEKLEYFENAEVMTLYPENINDLTGKCNLLSNLQ